jgi:methionine-rich copper-binding protein CopC
VSAFVAARPWRRRLVVWSAGAALGLLLVLAVTSAAEAHSVLLRTSPVASGSVAQAPDTVQLMFNERPQGRFSVVHVTGPDGGRRDAGSVSVLNDTVSESISGTRPAGRYTVDWRVVSADGHPVSGQFAFTTQHAAAPLAAPVARAGSGASAGSGGLSRHLWHVVLPALIAVGLVLGITVYQRAAHRRAIGRARP